MRRSPSARAIDRGYLEGRNYARQNYFNIDMASDEEIVKYNLDEIEITGEDVDRTYIVDRPIDLFGENGLDIRTLDTR